MKHTRFFLAALLVFCICPVSADTVPDQTFFQACREASASTEDPRVFRGADGWYFLKAELEHLSKGVFWGQKSREVSRAARPDTADPLPAIVDFNNQLKARGIELILVPVPAKAAVYPDKMNTGLSLPGNRRLDYYHHEFYALLRQEGVQVLDIMPGLLAQREKGNQVYCATDAHWSAFSCEITAAQIAGYLKEKSWYPGTEKDVMTAASGVISVTGDLAGGVSEPLEVRTVTGPGGKYIEAASDSPVVLMGDSHVLVFREGADMLARGAGLFDQLAYELGFAPDLIGVRGSGSTASRVNLFRKSKQDPEYLQGKKALIWCFSVREFTESTGGWRLVPVSP
ncbi:MAG: hypothetical protein JXB03_03175 [Spirochaetales bacterium]|nr:hypothetical protein [Spirochaetales bacterium]